MRKHYRSNPAVNPLYLLGQCVALRGRQLTRRQQTDLGNEGCLADKLAGY